MTFRFAMMLATAVLTGLSGCATTGPRFDPNAVPGKAGTADFSTVKPDGLKVSGEMLKPPTEAYRVGAGDRLEIEMMEFPETFQRCLILPDGTLCFHTITGLRVAGMTVTELKAALEKELATDYRSPQVAIILREATSRRAWVLGRLKKPGVYPLDAPTTIIDAISRAGGIATARSFGTTEDLADLRHSFLLREGKFVPVDFTRLLREGDMSLNLYLQHGDYLYFPSAQSQRAYVLGAVQTPKAVDFATDLTLVSAIANAQGLAKSAYPQRVLIIRGSLHEPKVAVVNLNAVMSGKDRDVVLEPQDIVWVPNSPYEKIDQYLGQVLSSFVRTVAANEGARAAVPSAQPVGTSVGIGN